MESGAAVCAVWHLDCVVRLTVTSYESGSGLDRWFV